MQVLFWLLCVHALTDFSLQTDAMAKGKNRHVSTSPVGWPYWLTAHVLIAGGGVGLVLGSPLIGALYALSHWVTDWAKCEGRTTIHIDQAIHLAILGVLAVVVG